MEDEEEEDIGWRASQPAGCSGPQTLNQPAG